MTRQDPIGRYEKAHAAKAEDAARLKAIHARVVEKLKEVVREFAITQDELHLAADYFNRLGRSGMARSLIDVSLAMTSIDATIGRAGGTRHNLEGPFHTPAPLRPDGNLLDEPPQPGARRLTLSGVVTDAKTGAPLTGAKLDVWQADNEGRYDHEGDHLRGVVVTDAQGRYLIRTVLPRHYSDHDGDPIGELYGAMGRHCYRAAHIHLKAFLGEREVLTTQLFVPGGPYLDSDYVEGAVSDDLMLALEPDGVDERGEPAFTARFDFALAGGPEPAAGP